MHKLTFFPLGNADCCRIDLEAGEKILFDYADMRCAEDDSDLRIDLPAELRQDLKAANRDFYDAVGYYRDHIGGSSRFFFCDAGSYHLNGNDYAFLNSGGTFKDIKVPNAATSEATGINGNGYITANAFVNSKLRGFTARCH